MKFKQFILNEEKQYLSQKIGDLLSAIHDLRGDSVSMSNRDLVRYAERIVNQIRKILHSNWSKDELSYLGTLQKVGVALMKAIDEKENLSQTISGAASVVEKLVSDMGTPINFLGSQYISKNNDDSNNLSSSEKIRQKPVMPREVKPAENKPVAPPTDTGQELYAPPLGNAGDGFSANFDAM
jgi:hypothetical protein